MRQTTEQKRVDNGRRTNKKVKSIFIMMSVIVNLHVHESHGWTIVNVLSALATFLVQLIKSKCIPVLLYGLEVCPLNKSLA